MTMKLLIVITLLCSYYIPSLTHNEACRDRFLWPFSTNSVWNMPIGSSATFIPTNIYTTHLPPDSFHNDQDFIILTTSSDPLTPWINQGDWNGGDKCSITGKQADSIPLPTNFVTGCVLNNNAMGLLLPDNRTLLQMQPAYREKPGSPFLARYHTGAPVPFPWKVDILGDSPLGAHGGSGLSAVGGTIRKGELLETSGPIKHALKLELYAAQYYYYGNATDCYTWPATGCDGYAATVYKGTNFYVKPGSLLAIPQKIANTIKTTTVPGTKIKEALINYGGYLVDDTADNTGAICMEQEVTTELLKAYNISVDISNPCRSPSQFYLDLVSIFKGLYAVTNNHEGNIGGGGTPLQPLAPPLC